MYRYSISKYFEYINKDDDWISITDIGSIYNGKILTIEEYKKVEDSYILAILEIIKYMKINKIYIKNIEKYRSYQELNKYVEEKNFKKLYNMSILNIYNSIENNVEIDISNISDILRLCLREDIYAFIYTPYKLRIFIGYDFMMGVHTSKLLEPIFNRIKSLNIYIYRF